LCIFSNLFQRIPNQREILRFDTHIEFLKENNFFALISTFLKTLIAYAQETAQKNGISFL